jgi:Holliday junction resolvase RusA-like endonuclease
MDNTKTVTRILKLIIPFTPCSLNVYARAHWAKRRRIQDFFDVEVVKALAQAGEGARLVKLFERAKIRIRYFFRTKHKRDKDNYTPKVIMDCLKGRVIVDDSSDRVDLDWELLYNRKAPRTEVVMEEIK